MKVIDISGKKGKITQIISEEYPTIGYSYLQKILRKGDIRLNGKKTYQDLIIEQNDKLTVYIPEQIEFNPKIIYEDENIIAFFKPKKIPSQGVGSFEYFVKNKIDKRLILVHRLDTNTDGILLFAKNQAIFEELKNAFSNKKIEKHYYALIYGELNQITTFKDFLFKDQKKSLVLVSSEYKKGYMEAVTICKPIQIFEKSTLIDVSPITGRTHQIRAQLSFHGYPIIGDGKYGNEKINSLFKKKTQQLTAYKIIFHIDSGILSYLNKKEIFLETSLS